MKTVYRFKPWARLSGDPQRVGEEIERLREVEGTIAPERIVDHAREPESVLHGYFTWDDSTAAEAFRVQQARHLLRSIVVVQAEGVNVKAPVRAFVALRPAADDAVEDGADESTVGSYTSISAAVRVVRYREQMMRDALRDLDAYRLKYQLLSDVSGWGSALERARAELQRVMDEAAKQAA
jgi:hypothetical protein